MKTVSILLVEESERDADLIAHHLDSGDLTVQLTVIHHAENFRSLLETSDFDVILSDFHIPGFSIFAALEIYRKIGLDIPFIVVSGAVGEEKTVELMRAGAHDFILKSNLQRLLPVIERGLRELKMRREKRAAEVALTESELRFKSYFDYLGDCVSILDPVFNSHGEIVDFTIGYVNQQVSDSNGFSQDEQIGSRLFELFPKLREDGLFDIYRDLVLTGIPVNAEVSFKSSVRQGVAVTHDIRASKMKNGIIVSWRDITESKQVQFQLARAVEQRDSVLAVVSHDLKNPLSAIKMNASLISVVGPEKVPVIATRIVKSADRMDRLIDDLLNISKIEGGGLILELASHKLSALFRDVEQVLKPMAVEKGVHLVFDAVPEETILVCDFHRFYQVLSNLVGNAIKFTESSGVVQVGFEFRDPEIIIHVRDTGRGMSQEDLPKVFDRFWQTQATRKMGTGLGLSIAKGIIEAHDGHIWVESDLGKGTTFSFSIPRLEVTHVEVESDPTVFL